jgi:hypothetical protein
VLALDGVRRVERADGGLRVLTHRPDALFDLLASLAGGEGTTIDAVVPLDEDLEAVFRYLTR